ncbi:hypothetical protein WSK_2193 [Novosphingobium sp. Rr 2-17]|uniref:hypothetical protein n=1 Tax=Novosphingobium sp. Rr 2-17 TaxID=555793 RepID=UPI000269951E|nr:hypothetical protein [Novosphingobium sp. Rr 2-17]EIZ79347.1 hypothetical protein WSK_2193 [Novosphingobium sp. Rr 2-17]
MDWQSLIYGSLSLISGVPMLLFPAQKRNAAVKAWKSRMQEIKAGKPEQFFEELRSLEAYPPYSTDRKWRAVGALLTFGGVVMLVNACYP